MAEVSCDDGSVLDVRPVAVLDRAGTPYEVTLELIRDGAPFGAVGERCGGLLSRVAEQLVEVGLPGAAARELRAPLGDRWPLVAVHLPRDRELFALAARDPDDVRTAGALRAVVREERRFADGRWQRRPGVLLEAWGDAGSGVRARLDLPALQAFLAALMREVAAVEDG